MGDTPWAAISRRPSFIALMIAAEGPGKREAPSILARPGVKLFAPTLNVI
jgi:hypothetical protein